MTSAPYREVPPPLKDAPREVPLAIRLRVRFGGVPQIVGWLFLGVGVSWVIVMTTVVTHSHGPRAVPAWTIFLQSPMLIIGAILVLFSQRTTGRATRLLRDGKVAYGKLIAKHSTPFFVNRQLVFAMTFEFEVDDERYKTIARTHEPWKLEDDKREQLLYDPLNPKQATLIDHLPGAPRVDEHGKFAVPSMFPTLLTLLPFIVAILMMSGALLVAILV